MRQRGDGGGNQRGELDDGSNSNRLKPVQMGTATNWRNVVAGSMSRGCLAVAIRVDGFLWVWGQLIQQFQLLAFVALVPEKEVF